MATRVLVSGARGLIGSALLPRLRASGREVAVLTRHPAAGRHEPDAAHREIVWDPPVGRLEPRALEGLEAVVHLAGEPMGVRWTPHTRALIRESRVGGTRLLATRLAALERPPRVLVAVSAIGFYGDRGEETLDESSAAGRGFLAGVCRDWEAAATPAAAAGIRVVHPRLGLVLAPGGGAVARMLPLFRLGLGGPLGDGRAWWSWVAVDDVVRAIEWMLDDPALAGAVNVAAPGAVRNRDFARTLARLLGRPALLPAPAFALRALLGGMADEALLASARVEPARLRAAGFEFRHPELETALRQALGRTPWP